MDTTPDPPAATYSHGHHASVLRSHRWRTAENSAAHLLPHLRPGLRLLDVGSGAGTITADLAALLAPGEVVGLDSAAAAVEATTALAAERGLPNLRAVQGSAYDLAAAGGGFDVVHAHQVLQHLADPVVALRAMAAACGPDGLVAVRDADYAAMTWYPEDAGLSRWLELYRAVARANGGEPDAGRRLAGWARDAGLRTVSASASVWCFATPEDLGWWSTTWAERLTASAFGRQGVELGLTDAGELDRLAAAWRAWGQRDGAWFAVLHGDLLARP
ncbi:methyltransferase domain-containing protein [Microlunatus capsulatus]|uniref:SAM-dependent methyltransferase n=1 Tax=Microlunatus capsulatus TaxID=99117 RepID=A0ABS4ZBA3_9ACTN|nr:methyltransferase domain-containing protein [Microlunatus capsulatus]MBP2418342.1 SAM-dependent methyltransferase [Microlunatus capsulatus]